MRIVVDASVALKWQFEDEEATGGATALLEDYVQGRIELITLTLFPYEIVSAIDVAINRSRIKEKDGYRAVEYITSLGVELLGFDDLVMNTFEMARTYGLSAYDCAYMALAEKEKSDFFTGDKKLLKALKGHFPWVKWIGDYPENRLPM